MSRTWLRLGARHWFFTLLFTILQLEAFAYFGLTGKNQIRYVPNIDEEALFIAGDDQTELFTWNENGYYTAPSNGYDRIDMSPQPDAVESKPTRGQRLKKNAVSRQPESEHSLEKETQNAEGEGGKETRTEMANQPPQKGQSPAQRPGHPHNQPPRSGYPGVYRRFPRHPYARRPYPYSPGFYNYGKDGGVRVIGPTGARGRPILRIYPRPPSSRQAISRPVHTVNIDGMVDKDPTTLYGRRITRRKPTLTYQHAARGISRRPVTGGNPRQEDTVPGRIPHIEQSQRDEAVTEGRPSYGTDDTRTQGSRRKSKGGRKRHLNGKHAPTSLRIQTLLSRQGLVLASEADYIGANNKSAEAVIISPDSAKSGEETADGTQIKPLFNLEEGIPSISTFTGIDEEGNEYMGVNGGIDPSDLTASMGADSGSRVTDLPAMIPSGEINKKEARKKCDEIKLTKKQRKFCRRDPGMPQVLEEATAMSAAECQYQFRYERWNCSTGTTRIHLLSKGTRETAFLFAISSAGLIHSVARACAAGHLERCSCEETFSDNLNKEAWRWGGCGDNVQFAAKLVRQFLKSKSQSRDIRAEVDKHNSDIGIRIVRQSVQQTCKCHGVSGSCTTKSCWRKVAPFYDIGQKIKRAYDRSIKVGSINSANGRPKLVRLRRSRRNRPPPDTTSKNRTGSQSSARRIRGTQDRPTNDSTPEVRSSDESHFRENPRNNELVYLENSPAYCRRTRFSLGTKGRLCDKEKNCDKICCGRGYTTHIRIVRRSCKCEVKWCCYVKCQTCTERKEVYTCK